MMPAPLEALQSRRRRGRAGRRLAAAACAAALAASAGALAAALGFAGPGPRAAAGGRAASPAARPAERAAHIAVVDVDVVEGGDEAFLSNSLENARNSVKEDGNLRFDVLQSQDDISRFVLVEMYDSAEGPVGHKATDHYLSWRESVADLMASPRQASQWEPVFPSQASSYKPDVIILEREEPNYCDVRHIYVNLKPGFEDEFIKATIRNAKETYTAEEGNLRLDLLRSVDDPTKFLMIEVFRKPEASEMHRRTDHFARWRDTTVEMMAEPLVFKKYYNHFPNLPAGWKVDPGAQ